jgi:excisionase family DNA binding protein
MEKAFKPLNYTVGEASALWNCSKDTTRRGIARGEIRTVRFGRRVLILASEVERVAREGLSSQAAKPTRAGRLRKAAA